MQPVGRLLGTKLVFVADTLHHHCSVPHCSLIPCRPVCCLTDTCDGQATPMADILRMTDSERLAMWIIASIAAIPWLILLGVGFFAWVGMMDILCPGFEDAICPCCDGRVNDVLVSSDLYLGCA